MVANIAVLAAVFFALYSGSAFKWHIFKSLVDDRKRPKPVVAYTYGVTCIIAGFSALVAINGLPVESLAILIAVSVAAGLGTIATRVFDRILDKTADD